MCRMVTRLDWTVAALAQMPALGLFLLNVLTCSLLRLHHMEAINFIFQVIFHRLF